MTRDSDLAAALGPLGDSHRLPADQVTTLARLLELLLADEQVPTGIRTTERAIEVHLADSLSALEIGAVRSARSLVDLGSGAGLPGLALAVVLPRCEVVLLESQMRKSRFIASAIERLELANAEAVCDRAETWREGRLAHDLVTARALAPQPVVLEYAAPLLALGGTLVDWRGARRRQEEAADRAAAELGLVRAEVRSVTPYPAAREHHLHVFRKVGDTPPRFPRRPGMARKRPLGA